jgi:hypothetical protein
MDFLAHSTATRGTTLNNYPKQPSQCDPEEEIRRARRFTSQEALARMAGPGALKGASPVPREQQAENEIASWLAAHMGDPPGALKCVLCRHLEGTELLLNNLDQPLTALTNYCSRILASDERLKDLVREADVEWGRLMSERPYFDRDDSYPHREDPYTLESVRKTLNHVLESRT